MIGTNNINKITHSWKAEVTLNPQTMAQIATLHTLVPNNLEWSGRLLYKVTEGSVEDKNIKMEAIGIFPCDIGTSGGTSFDIMNHFDALDELYDLESNDYKQGIIHTHHNMTTFFSGTDWSDLTGSAESEFKRGWCLSVIVNYAMDIQAKMCWVEESKTEIPEYVLPAKKIEIVQFGKKTPVTIQPEKVIPASVVSEIKHHIVDCDIFIQSNLNDQIAKLEKIRAARPAPVYKTIGKEKVVIGDNPNADWFNYQTSMNDDFLPPLPRSQSQVYEYDPETNIIDWAFYTFKHVKMKGDSSRYKNLDEVFKDILDYLVKNRLTITSDELCEYIDDGQDVYNITNNELYNYLVECSNVLSNLLTPVNKKHVENYLDAIGNTLVILTDNDYINEQNIDITEK